MPKVSSVADLNRIGEAFYEHARPGTHFNLVASIESARALWNVGDIAGWRPQSPRLDTSLQLRALLVGLVCLFRILAPDSPPVCC